MLEARAAFLAEAVQVVGFDGETPAQRVARRRARWTPVIWFD